MSSQALSINNLPVDILHIILKHPLLWSSNAIYLQVCKLWKDIIHSYTKHTNTLPTIEFTAISLCTQTFKWAFQIYGSYIRAHKVSIYKHASLGVLKWALAKRIISPHNKTALATLIIRNNYELVLWAAYKSYPCKIEDAEMAIKIGNKQMLSLLFSLPTASEWAPRGNIGLLTFTFPRQMYGYLSLMGACCRYNRFGIAVFLRKAYKLSCNYASHTALDLPSSHLIIAVQSNCAFNFIHWIYYITSGPTPPINNLLHISAQIGRTDLFEWFLNIYTADSEINNSLYTHFIAACSEGQLDFLSFMATTYFSQEDLKRLKRLFENTIRVEPDIMHCDTDIISNWFTAHIL